MNCTKHFLFLRWTRHSWHPSVSWAHDYTCHETDMWGRTTTREFVTCQKQHFCSVCGATKGEAYCGCDKTRAEHCAVRLKWLEGAHQSAPVAMQAHN